MAIMKWVNVDGDKIPLMEKKIRDKIRECEDEIQNKKEEKEIKYEALMRSVEIKSYGDRITRIGKEMEELESDIRRLKEKKKMLEYFLNDELEA